MSAKVAIRMMLGAGILAGGAVLYGCGGTNGSSEGTNNFPDSHFDPQNVGTISLNVLDDRLQVSEITGFGVSVKDKNGAGIPQTRVSCDSELGVAIIEPSTGAEITDAGGNISGKLGCVTPGSYLFGCRLPVGGEKRVFTTIHCGGPIPAGFTGFPGAAGGTLGTGGSSGSDNGGSGGTDNGNGTQITAVTLDDGFGASTSIDIKQAPDCGSGTAEKFFDTTISITVRNNTNQTVTYNSYSFAVSGLFHSDDIALTGAVTVAPGATATLSSLFMHAVPAAGGGQKSFVGASSTLDPNNPPGVKNITVTLHGTNSLGQAVEASASTVASFATYNHC